MANIGLIVVVADVVGKCAPYECVDGIPINAKDV
jgi:hypothetical protein